MGRGEHAEDSRQPEEGTAAQNHGCTWYAPLWPQAQRQDRAERICHDAHGLLTCRKRREGLGEDVGISGERRTAGWQRSGLSEAWEIKGDASILPGQVLGHLGPNIAAMKPSVHEDDSGPVSPTLCVKQGCAGIRNTTTFAVE
jgi:hypothetical protein